MANDDEAVLSDEEIMVKVLRQRARAALLAALRDLDAAIDSSDGVLSKDDDACRNANVAAESLQVLRTMYWEEEEAEALNREPPLDEGPAYLKY